MKKKLTLLFSSCALFAFSQNCPNIGFEEGTVSSWTCLSGTFGMVNPPKCNTTLPLILNPGACQDQGGIDGTNKPVNFSENRHTIMSNKTGKDPNSNGTVSYVAPGNLFPSGTNNYSFRIGNAVGMDDKSPDDLAMAEGIRYTLTVDKNNAGVTYMYAAFVQEAKTLHPTNQAPRFEVRITDNSGALIPCGYYQVIAGAATGFKDGLKDDGGQWKYTDWTKVGLDLSGYIGKQVTIEFRTNDCFPSAGLSIININGQIDTTCTGFGPGSHSAYAYIDMYCTPIDIVSPVVCANQATMQLCAPAGYATYQWPSGQPGMIPPLDKQCVTINNPKIGDKYTVKMTAIAGGCPTTATITLGGLDFTVKDVNVCTGAPPVTLNAVPTTTGTYDWKWEPGINLSCTDCKDPIFTPGITTTYTITMTDKVIANCSQVKKLTVTVGASFTVSTADAEICEGEQVTLTATGADAYTWKDPTNTTLPPTPTITVSPITTTTYTVTGTSATATCPGNPTATATVTVSKKPIVIVTDQTICVGESAILTGSITGGASAGTWIGGTGTFIPDRNTIVATYKPTAAEETAGTVTLTLESGPVGPCVKVSKTMTLTIIPAVTSDAGPDQNICEGSTITLAAKFGGATSGSWSGGTGVYAPNSNTANAVYTPSQAEENAGKITLTFTINDPPGPCPAVSDAMTITIDQLPVAIAGTPGSICAGDQIKLNGKIKGAATEGTWSGGNGIFSKNNKDLTATYAPTPQEIATGKITLKLTTNTTGLCPIAVDSVTFIINPKPVVKFVVDTPKACPPHCVDFFDSTTVVGSNVIKWDWDFGIKGGTNGTVKNPQEICYTAPGFYDVTLTVTSDKRCRATLTKKEMIETYQVPVANFTATPNPVTLYDPTIHFFDQSTPDVKSWTWNLGDGKIVSPNTKNPVHQYTIGVSATYMVKLFVVNANGCVDSTKHPVNVLPEFTFFIPNAFTPIRADGINDTFFGKGVGIVEYHIWIFDRWGNMVFSATDINTGWDGRANNGADVAQQDVFAWKVQLKDVFGKTHDYIGTVTLVK
jgi:gliding motility-associated-like protein